MNGTFRSHNAQTTVQSDPVELSSLRPRVQRYANTIQTSSFTLLVTRCAWELRVGLVCYSELRHSAAILNASFRNAAVIYGWGIKCTRKGSLLINLQECANIESGKMKWWTRISRADCLSFLVKDLIVFEKIVQGSMSSSWSVDLRSPMRGKTEERAIGWKILNLTSHFLSGWMQSIARACSSCVTTSELYGYIHWTKTL